MSIQRVVCAFVISVASVWTGGDASACQNDGTPGRCMCKMKMELLVAAAGGAYATPTFTPLSLTASPTDSALAPATPVSTVHVGTDSDGSHDSFYYFDPGTVTVNVGDTVRWIEDNLIHTVTSDLDPSNPLYFDSGVLSPGDTFDFTFTKPGVYKYHCGIHDFQNADGSWAGPQLGIITVVPEPTAALMWFGAMGAALSSGRRLSRKP